MTCKHPDLRYRLGGKALICEHCKMDSEAIINELRAENERLRRIAYPDGPAACAAVPASDYSAMCAEADRLRAASHKWNKVYLVWSSQRQCMDAREKLVKLVMKLFEEHRDAASRGEGEKC